MQLPSKRLSPSLASRCLTLLASSSFFLTTSCSKLSLSQSQTSENSIEEGTLKLSDPSSADKGPDKTSGPDSDIGDKSSDPTDVAEDPTLSVTKKETPSGNADAAFSSGGRHLYAVAPNDHKLLVYQRDSSSNALTLAQTLTDSESTDGLDAPTGVAVSPDGRHVVTVSGGSDDAVTVFSRDFEQGTLTWAQTLKNGASGVSGLAEASALCFSPDGNHLYVTGAESGSGTLAVFSRDVSTGQLTWVESHQNGAAGVRGILGASAVVTSIDGLSL